MPNLDDIAQKRLDDRSEKAELERQASIDSFLSTSRDIVKSTGTFATSGDIDNLMSQLAEELQNVTTLEVDKLEELHATLTSILTQLNSSENNKQLQQSAKILSSLATAVENLGTTTNDSSKTGKKQLDALLKAFQAVDFAPVINVPQPKVTVKPAVVDFTPLQNTMREYFAPPENSKIDLDCYKAQDIDNSVDGYQYVGFVNAEGEWYIIENDVKGDRLRYVFGADGYAKAFGKASSYQYMLLNEAIDAL